MNKQGLKIGNVIKQRNGHLGKRGCLVWIKRNYT